MGINRVDEVYCLCKNRRPSVVSTKRLVDEIFFDEVSRRRSDSRPSVVNRIKWKGQTKRKMTFILDNF